MGGWSYRTAVSLCGRSIVLVWILLAVQGLVILTGLWLIRSFGKWAKQILDLNNSNRILLEEVRAARFGAPRDDDAFNHAQLHTAVFMNLDEPPPEERAS